MRQILSMLVTGVVMGALAACASGTAVDQEYVPTEPQVIAGGTMHVNQPVGGGFDVDVALLGAHEDDSITNIGPDRPEKPVLYTFAIQLDEARDLVSIQAFNGDGSPLHPDAWSYTSTTGSIIIEMDGVLPLFDGFPPFDTKLTPQDIHVVVNGRPGP